MLLGAPTRILLGPCPQNRSLARGHEEGQELSGHCENIEKSFITTNYLVMTEGQYLPTRVMEQSPLNYAIKSAATRRLSPDLTLCTL